MSHVGLSLKLPANITHNFIPHLNLQYSHRSNNQEWVSANPPFFWPLGNLGVCHITCFRLAEHMILPRNQVVGDYK